MKTQTQVDLRLSGGKAHLDKRQQHHPFEVTVCWESVQSTNGPSLLGRERGVVVFALQALTCLIVCFPASTRKQEDLTGQMHAIFSRDPSRPEKHTPGEGDTTHSLFVRSA